MLEESSVAVKANQHKDEDFLPNNKNMDRGMGSLLQWRSSTEPTMHLGHTGTYSDTGTGAMSKEPMMEHRIRHTKLGIGQTNCRSRNATTIQSGRMLH